MFRVKQPNAFTEYLGLDSFYWRSASVEIWSNNLPCWMFMLAALPSTLSGYARDVWRDRVSARGERGRVRARLRAPLSAQSFLLLWSGRMVGWYYFFKVTNLFPAQLLQCIAVVIMHTKTFFACTQIIWGLPWTHFPSTDFECINSRHPHDIDSPAPMFTMPFWLSNPSSLQLHTSFWSNCFCPLL